MGEGQYDNVEMENSSDPMVRKMAQDDIALTEAIKAKMSPPGALNLPPLLETKRLDFGITDGAFATQCAFERVFVFQIGRVRGNNYEGSSLVMPDTVAHREMRECSRAIVVSAGLLALDQLRSNGIDLGHTVQMIRNAPWRILVDKVGGKDMHLVVLNAGDILGSEELAVSLRSGAARVVATTNEKGATEHLLQDPAGQLWKPQQPWISEDF